MLQRLKYTEAEEQVVDLPQNKEKGIMNLWLSLLSMFFSMSFEIWL